MTGFRRIQLSIGATAVFLCFSHARDRIVLNDGSTFVGSIVREDPQTVTIKYQSDSASGILPIIKADIKQRVTLSEEEDEFDSLSLFKLHPRHSLIAQDYVPALKMGKSFLRKFPASPLVPKVQIIIKDWEDEYQKVSQGKIKSAGKWYDQVRAKDRDYDIKANLLYDDLVKALGRNDQAMTLEIFDSIQTKYPKSSAYFLSVPQVIQLLGKQRSGFSNEIQALNTKISNFAQPRAEYSKLIAKNRTKMSAAGSEESTQLKNQLAIIEGQLGFIDQQEKVLRQKIGALESLHSGLSQKIDILQTIPVESLKKATQALDQAEEFLTQGEYKSASELISTPHVKDLPGSETVRKKVEQHNVWVRDIELALNKELYDEAIDKSQTALREISGSKQLQTLLDKAVAGKKQSLQSVN